MSLLSRLFGVPDEPARPAAKAKASSRRKPTTAGKTAAKPRAAGGKGSASAPPSGERGSRPSAARSQAKSFASQDTAPAKPLARAAKASDPAPKAPTPSTAKARQASAAGSGSTTAKSRALASQRSVAEKAPRASTANSDGSALPTAPRRPKNKVASERPAPAPRVVQPDEPEDDATLPDDPLALPAEVPIPPPVPLVEAAVEEEGSTEDKPGGRGKVKVIATGQRARLRGDVGKMARTIEKALVDLGAPAHVVAASVGPTITRFGLAPAIVERYSPDGVLRKRERVRVGKIASRANDLALVLGARTLRIEAPVPGQSYVGLEVPNPEASSVTVASLLAEKSFKEFVEKAKLPFALGRDVAGRPIFADVTRLPHLLVAGATGAGKSVALNALLAALLRHRTPEQLRLLVLDPKRVEFAWLERAGHLLAPVVVEPEEAVQTLGRLETEMTRRYDLLAEASVRDLARYNAKAQTPVPYLVLVVDELADLMMLASNEVERSICRLAQLGRAAGIHLVVATQRPSVDVITGLIKANLPARLAFAVASQVDSRTVLDSVGAELLLGRGDFLYQAPDAAKPVRGQGAFVSEEDVQKLARRVRRKGAPDAYARQFAELKTPAARAASELLRKARDLAITYDDRVSASFLQRKLRIGYAKAKELVEALREEGLVDDEDE